MNYHYLILSLVGLFSIVGATANWDWFMEHRKAKLWVKLFGRNGARVFYVLFGSVLVTVGGLLSAGII